MRIVVSGTTGTGKSTLAAELARRLRLPCVELDALHFLPGWTPVEPALFRRTVDAATAGEGWVVAGNYSVVRDLTWGRADTIVWLDYPFGFTARRLLRRTLRRALTQELLWGTNRESFRQSFFTRDSILLWFLKTHGKRRHDFPPALAEQVARGACVVRLRSQAATEAWLAGLAPEAA